MSEPKEYYTVFIENWNCPKCGKINKGVYSKCLHCSRPSFNKNKEKPKLKWYC